MLIKHLRQQDTKKQLRFKILRLIPNTESIIEYTKKWNFYSWTCFAFSMGAPVMVELEGETDPLQIAMKELK